jgi:hypothetical protein
MGNGEMGKYKSYQLITVSSIAKILIVQSSLTGTGELGGQAAELWESGACGIVPSLGGKLSGILPQSEPHAQVSCVRVELVELFPPLMGNCLGYFRSQNPMLR